MITSGARKNVASTIANTRIITIGTGERMSPIAAGWKNGIAATFSSSG
jgi:hypothetical protein